MKDVPMWRRPEDVEDGQDDPIVLTGASRDPYLGRRKTRPDYPRYVRWCQSLGIRPQATEPLAYGLFK